MPESFSLDDLFSKKVTREQFIEKYKEIKKSGEAPELSIFDDGMDVAIDTIFDAVDTDKDGTISESELTDLKALGKDDKEVLSDDDLEVVYQKITDEILSKYNDLESPEKMYANAIKQVNGDMRQSNYVEDLDNDINILIEMMNKRRFSSTAKIIELQSQISKEFAKIGKLDKEIKEQYEKTTNEINKLRQEQAETKSKIARTEQQIKSNKDYMDLIKKELDALNKNDDKKEIEVKQKELSELNTENNKLNTDLTNYLKKDKDLSDSIQKANKSLLDFRAQALKKNDNIKSKIGQLQAQLFAEQELVKNDISNYKNKINQLHAAKTYAYKQIPAEASREVMASHNNDNAVTFDELKSQGVKYSSAKGQKLAQDVGSHAHGFIGRCSNRVANGLQRTGLGHERMNSAHMMDSELRKNNNFREIKVNSKEELRNLPAGCIVVYEAGAAGYNAKHGHIEVTLGNGTAASDGITRNMRYSNQMSVFIPVENA